MLYQNEKTRIRPFEKTDLTERYRSWFNDPIITRFNSWGLFPYTPEQARVFVATIEGDRSRIIWAIEILIKNTLNEERMCYEDRWIHIGNVSLQSINFLNRSAELAVVLGESRGKGIGRQACQWAVDHAFKKLALQRIWSGTASTNIPMQKVFDKCGFKKEGVFRQGMFLDGEFVDVFSYGLLFDEWKLRNENRQV